MTIHKANSDDAGCWIDGHWSQYGVARMIQIADAHGYDNARDCALAEKKLAAMMPSMSPQLSDDEETELSEASDDAEQWLNDNVAPQGYSFGWYEGEFFLQSESWWQDV